MTLPADDPRRQLLGKHGFDAALPGIELGDVGGNTAELTLPVSEQVVNMVGTLHGGAIATLVDHGLPVFGICLGHQLLALACGARTVKMKFGHHGANHPVKELSSGRVFITSQNHGFAVDETSLPATLAPTHVSLFDGSLQGVHHRDHPAFGFQGHPEASPGPHDVQPLFDHFIDLMAARD